MSSRQPLQSTAKRGSFQQLQLLVSGNCMHIFIIFYCRPWIMGATTSVEYRLGAVIMIKLRVRPIAVGAVLREVFGSDSTQR